MIEQRSGVVDQHLVARRGDYLLSVPYGVGKAAIDKVTRDTAFELQPHGVTVVSLWPGLVLTEGLLANTVRDRRRAPRAPRPRHQLRGDAEVQRRRGRRARGRSRRSSSAPAARSGPRRWRASTASPRTTATSRRRWPTPSSPAMGDDMPDYWRGVERARAVRLAPWPAAPTSPPSPRRGSTPTRCSIAAARRPNRSSRVQLPFGEPRLDAHPLRRRADDARRRALQPHRDHRHRHRRAWRSSSRSRTRSSAWTRPSTRASADSSAASSPPRRMQALRGRAQEIVDGLLDAMEQAEQPVDFVQAVALPLPITMICELLGVPFEDRERFNGWADIFMTSSGYTVEELLDAHGQLTALPRRADRQAARRTDRRHPRRAGRRTRRGPIRSSPRASCSRCCMAILVAGYETTANQLGKFVLCLLERPDQLQTAARAPGARWPTRSRS